MKKGVKTPTPGFEPGIPKEPVSSFFVFSRPAQFFASFLEKYRIMRRWLGY